MHGWQGQACFAGRDTQPTGVFGALAESAYGLIPAYCRIVLVNGRRRGVAGYGVAAGSTCETLALKEAA